MTTRRRESDPVRRTPRHVVVLYWLVPFAASVVAVAGVLTFHQFERFLITDERFRLEGPRDFGADPPNLTVTGARYSSRREIRRTFEPDCDRSIYLLPVRERRLTLLGVDWVREATVSRRWPNRVAVEILERRPVAFVRRPADRQITSRFALIDEEGVILPPPVGARFNLPLLAGVTERDPETRRRECVRPLIRLLREAGELGDAISEVNARDPGSIVVTAQVKDKVVTLLIGGDNFRQRLETFYQYYPGIEKRLPNARIFDLRLEGQFTVKDGEAHGE